MKKEILDFGEAEQNSIIKVIGVGGGGGNAVNHMYREGIHDVTFVLCNTDAQALNDSPVPIHLQLGKEGLGAGNKPEKAREAAEETIDDIKDMLNDGTRMAFITAGMGGGTGTGAAPVIAKVSKDMGILTVGIVTIPFRFEGNKKIDQALDGVEEMSKHVDALLVINNERLREIYPEMSVLNAFGKADDTLSVAAKSIAEIITVHGLINLDFNDVKTVLKDGGVAIMSTGYGEGEGRVKQAIEDALNSPLLNDNDIYNSKKILLSINFSSDNNDNPGLTMEEMSDVNEFMSHFGNGFELKWGLALDPDLDKKVKVTILATGFGIKDVEGMDSLIKKHSLEEAARIAEQLGSAVRTVLPLSGLLAESALVGQVTERVARSAAALAHLDRDGVLDVIEVDDPSIIVPGFTAAMRDELLDVLGEYGVMVGRSVAHAQGAVGLMQWMRDVSGIDSLTDLLTGDNAYFAVLQRAVRMLDALEDLSNNYAVRDHVRWVQEILLGQPQMHEVLLYRSYRDTYVSTPDSSLLGPLRQAITATTSAEVAGLSPSADPASIRAKHEQELGRLQQLAMTPLSAAEDEARERLIIAHQQALRSMT